MSARDVVLIAVLTFVFAIGVFIIFFLNSTATEKLLSIPTVNESNITRTSLQAIEDKVTSRFDYLVFGLFIGFVLALIITGFLVGGHPIFSFIYFIFIVIAIILSTVLSNVWDTVTSASVFGTTITHFNISNHLLSNLPIYMVVVGFIGMVVLFAKPYIVNAQ